MTPNTENQEAKLVHGMRGALARDRMEQIHLGLPYSMTLRDVLPYLADPLIAPHVSIRMMEARVRLSYGWHMLNQARIALVEAEACTIFYEECQHNHTEALYRCQYYLDDAALRLHSSCEHMLRSVIYHWALSVPEKKSSFDESRDSLLVRVLKAAEQSKQSQARVDVGKLLRQLRSSKDWKPCMKHRNDWVHNQLPAITGLFPDIGFGRNIDYEKILPPSVLKDLGLEGKRCDALSVEIGRDISVLRGVVRNAYGELFGVYEGLANLLAKDVERTAR
jgi:hypothetical protein